VDTETLNDPVQVAASNLTDESPNVNSKLALTTRLERGQLTWTGPLLLVVGRSGLIIAAQAVTFFWLRLRFHSGSWNDAAKWWTVYGTLVDLGCLALMALFLRREGIRLRDLIGRVRLRWGRDIFLGAGILLLVFPFFILAAPAASRLLYGTTPLPAFAGLAAGRVLPLWAMIYSFSIWLLIWSPTEEITYQGYALPRLEVLCGSRWKAVALVSFWWAIQHPFLPFILDWKYFAWRFLVFLPSMVVLTLLYLKIRRLPPFFLAHWSMDTIALFMTLKF
jgi:membrane protease YdiL (CAAX protease family)